MPNDTSHTIVCLSSQIWDEGMWTNKQHVMSRLAARGHRVIHANFGLRPAPLFVWKKARRDVRELARPLRAVVPRPAVRGRRRVRRGEEQVLVVDAMTPLVAGLFEHGNPLRDWATFDRKVAEVARYLEREGIEDPIVWVYHPGYADALERLPRKLLVYDCVDNYAAFPTYRDNAGWLMQREEKLCRTADRVFCTAPALYESRRRFNPENTFLVHNVGDAEHFHRATRPELRVPQDLARLGGPVVGFVGAVSDYKLNLDWLEAVARARPDWQVVAIGPVGAADPGTDVHRLRQHPNVHLLGHRDYDELPAYLKGFDVAVIPYRINDYTRGVFPIKFFEFLATGKPVVTSPLPALQDYLPLVDVAHDPEGFVAACARHLDQRADTEEARRQRIEVAFENSWPRRVGRMMELVEEALESRGPRR